MCFLISTEVLFGMLTGGLSILIHASVNPKGNQPWIFTGRTDSEAEPPILWPPDAKSRLNGKDPDAGKKWRQKEKGVAEDEITK